jgi:anti-sigma factor RsiW
MNCDRARELFLEYHDGDLSDTDRQALEAHLETCEICRADWEAYQRTLGEVSGMFNVAPPADFAQRVKQTIGKRSRGRFFGHDRNLSINFAIVSFLLILLVILAYLFISSKQEIVLVEPSLENGDTQADEKEQQQVP